MPGDDDPRAARGDSAVEPSRPGPLTRFLVDLARGPEDACWEPPFLPGDAVGRFEIVKELGRGGFGAVYQARDRELQRSVAIKAIRPDRDDGVREKHLLAEAEAAARLAHPNIVQLYDVGRCERGGYLVMELLRGETLAERLSGDTLPLREAVRVAVEVSRGLAHAHAQGVVHRDLKPSNIFLCEDGQVKVLDFGLAQVFGAEGFLGGTPPYMAPELASGEAGDERSDAYSLAVVIREALTGRPWGDLAGGDPATAHGAISGVPEALARLLARMTAPDPSARPGIAGEAEEQLAAIQRSLEPRRPSWTGAHLAAIAVASAMAFALAWQRPPPPSGRSRVAAPDLRARWFAQGAKAVLPAIYRLSLEEAGGQAKPRRSAAAGDWPAIELSCEAPELASGGGTIACTAVDAAGPRPGPSPGATRRLTAW